ncbi:MAG: hypothetical protein ACOCRK_08800 [bacterium]
MKIRVIKNHKNIELEFYSNDCHRPIKKLNLNGFDGYKGVFYLENRHLEIHVKQLDEKVLDALNKLTVVLADKTYELTDWNREYLNGIHFRIKNVDEELVEKIEDDCKYQYYIIKE